MVMTIKFTLFPNYSITPQSLVVLQAFRNAVMNDTRVSTDLPEFVQLLSKDRAVQVSELTSPRLKALRTDGTSRTMLVPS